MLVEIPGYSRHLIDTETAEVFMKRKDGSLKLMSSRVLKNGYLTCHVYNDDGLSQIQSVHRLMALACIPLPEGCEFNRKLQVNHKDGNKLNNRPYNLEWCSQSYNIRYTIDKMQTKRARPIIMFKVMPENDVDIAEIVPSLRQAAIALGVAEMSLQEWLQKYGDTRAYHGYYVAYLDDWRSQGNYCK